jgi:hypothetical protein
METGKQMNELPGKWVQGEDQPYPGLYFEFFEDGTFKAELASMSITSSGTYQVGSRNITIDQQEHTLGMTGVFEGMYQIEGNTLTMALADGPGQPCPTSFDSARIYHKEEG